MISTSDLSEAFARNWNVVKMQTKDLTHADSLRQPPFHGNCLNWVLGHVVQHRDQILRLLGEPTLFEDRGERYKRGSEPLTADDNGVVSLGELLGCLDQQQARLAARLADMEDTAWAREITVGNQRTMTVGQRVFFLYFHETYHVGQTELFRQLAGKDDRVI